MLRQLKTAYDLHLWAKILAWLALFGASALLWRVEDGIPPRSWLMLAQSFTQLGQLIAARGPFVLIPFAALLVLSLSWIALWCLLTWLALFLVLPRRAGAVSAQKLAKNWRRSSADNLLDLGFDEPQASLAYAALKQRHDGKGDTYMSNSHHQDAHPQDTRHRDVRPPGAHQGRPYIARGSNPAPTTAQVSAQTRAGGEMTYVGTPLVGVRGDGVGDVGVGWDVGITRKGKPNEDSVLALHSACTFNGKLIPLSLYVVADGMGGHASGQVASHLATHSMMQTVLPTIQNGEDLSEEFLIDTLVDATHWANSAVYRYHEEHNVDLGTTITAALLVRDTAYIINVGDSRTYLYHKGEGLTQVTRDHSLVARLVAAGAIRPEDVYTHPDRNKVYRGLGEKDNVEVDWFVEPVQPGDFLLLCSDGLWEMVRDPEIEKILERCLPDANAASDALIKAALHRGGKDNVSAIVAKV